MERSFQPIVILPTYMGHLLYTPADIHESSHDTTFHGTLDVADMLAKDFGDRPVTEVMKTPSNIKSVFTFRSIYGPVVNCESTGLSVQSRAGRKKVTIDNYLERASVDKPSILVALADEIGPNAGHNRRRKAFERTWQWFTKCQQFLQDNADKLNTKLFAVVMNDSSNPLQLKKLTSSVLDSDSTQGIVLGGWFCGEDAEARRNMLTTVRELLAVRKLPIMVQGADSLEQIRECLALGVDMIQTSYPLRQMKDGFAFVPATGSKVEAKSDVSKRPREGDENDDQQSRKRAKVEEEATSFRPPALDDENNDGNQGQPSAGEDILPASVAGASAKASVIPDAASINLWNERYRKDLSVLQPGCKCHSCANNYTKSYIHHLLKSRELLADVLLYQHNQHQLKLLFDTIQSSTAIDSALPVPTV